MTAIFYDVLFSLCDECLCYNGNEGNVFQIAQNYFLHAAEAGNANAMAFLGKVSQCVECFVQLPLPQTFNHYLSITC